MACLNEYKVLDSSGMVICERTVRARSLVERTRGLLGQDSLRRNTGLFIESPAWLPVMWLHTFGMRFAIDIVFIDSNFRIRNLNANVGAGRVSSVVWNARYALEVAPGTIARTQIEVGDTINLVRLESQAETTMRRMRELGSWNWIVSR